VQLDPIGIIHSCFTEKFGVPRQSLMVSEARGTIKLGVEFSNPDTVLHLEEFSHLWVVYLFHKNQNANHTEKWSPTISPPRIDAPKKVGVFASRSPHRPNPIGLSVVKLEKINLHAKGGIEIEVSGVDILDGSPVLDIKPYVPYADIVPDATSGWIKNEITRYPVFFSEQAEQVLTGHHLKKLITEILEWDPRPRSQREQNPIENPKSIGKRFAFRLMDYDVHWVIDQNVSINVIEVKTLK
jgi:tRNA-Thr(GGU) m(6)t(6)A37 methyltransferase TsaA